MSLLILGVISAGIFYLTSSGVLSGTGAAVEELTPAPKTLSFWVEATGFLRATSVQDFGGPPAFSNYWQFQIVSLAPEGKRVQKDELLIQFDAQRLMEELQQVQNELDQAVKELEKTKVQADLEHQELLANLATAENNTQKLQLKQIGDIGIEASNKVAEDRVALEQAQREVESLKRRIEAHRQSSEATYKIIGSKKARAENKLNMIQRGMERFRVAADREGVVVYKTKWNGEKYQVGENVWSGQPVIEIPDLNTILAEAFVPEVDVGKIEIGQRAEITIDAFPGKSYTGTVTRLGTLVRPKAWDIPNKVLDVQLELEDLDPSIMRPAMSIKVKIETARRSDVIAVPLKALRTTTDGTMVKLKTDAGWQEKSVKVGESNGAEVIILEGLNPGDRIASDYSRVR